MTKNECKNEIFGFKVAVENYRRTMLNNENPLPYDTQYRLLNTLQSQLNQKYGKLEKYIDNIGGGIGQTYLTAFGEGLINDTVGALSSVIQNLDRVIGRLDGMTEKDFTDSFYKKDGKHAESPTANINIKLSIFEFVTSVLFAICFTLIFATTKIIGLTFYWSALWPYLLIFFGIVFLVTYIVLPVVEISRKVGINVKDIYNEFVLEFRNKSKLGKFKTVAAIILGVIGTVPVILWVFSTAIKYIHI